MEPHGISIARPRGLARPRREEVFIGGLNFQGALEIVVDHYHVELVRKKAARGIGRRGDDNNYVSLDERWRRWCA